MIELLKQFIPVADAPGRYTSSQQQGYFPRKDALEYHLLESAMLQTSWRELVQKHPGKWDLQGIYVITPSGKVLAGSNHPMNAEINLGSMRKGLEGYANMPRAERLLGHAPRPEKDRMFPGGERPRPPEGGLVLRVVGRGLEANIVEQCQFQPKNYILDRLWYTREEALQFLPDNLQVGQKKEVTGPVLSGLAQLNLNARGPLYYDDDVRELRLTSEVTETAGPTVKLRLSGRTILEAKNKWFPNKYRPDFLGHVTYDKEQKRFTRFELLAYGMHNLATGDMTKGGPDHIPMGFLFTLNPSNVNDDQAPTKLDLYRFVKLKAATR